MTNLLMLVIIVCFFFFQAEDGIRDAQESRGLGDVYKRQGVPRAHGNAPAANEHACRPRAERSRDGATACPRRRAPDTPLGRSHRLGTRNAAPRGKSRYRSRRPPSGLKSVRVTFHGSSSPNAILNRSRLPDVMSPLFV